MTLEFQGIRKSKKEGTKKPWLRSARNAATAVAIRYMCGGF